MEQNPAMVRHQHRGADDMFLLHDLSHDGIQVGAGMAGRRAMCSGATEKKQGKTKCLQCSHDDSADVVTFYWDRDKTNGALEALAEKRRCCSGDADDFVGCLPIEFEIELSPRAAVIPIGESLQLATPHGALRQRSSFDGNAHARRLTSDAALLPYGVRASDHTARNEALAALVLAREYESRIACGDLLAAIHRLLGDECESPCPRIHNFCFDRIRHHCQSRDKDRLRIQPQVSHHSLPEAATRQIRSECRLQ